MAVSLRFPNRASAPVAKTAAANLVPVRQRTQFTCMASSMGMCLGALGLQDCSEDTVNRVMGAAPMRGAAWEQALATAQHYGVRATLTVPATLSQVKEWTDAGKPVMIGWNPEGREWSHASVIFDVQPCPTHGFMVHVADPNCPDPEQTVRVVPKGEFYAKWYEKFPNYLVRRPALMLEREVTPEGRQVMASMKPVAKRATSVLVDEPLTVPVSEVPMSKQAKSPVPVVQKKNPNVVRGEAPAQRNPVVLGLIERGTSGAGKHKNKQDYERGHARNPKHKGQKGWGAEYMTLPVEEACGAEYMQDHAAKFEQGVSADPTKNMSEADAAEWERQNAMHRDQFKTATSYAEYKRKADLIQKASRAVPVRVAEQFYKDTKAFEAKSLSEYKAAWSKGVDVDNQPADPKEVGAWGKYLTHALRMLEALSVVVLPHREESAALILLNHTPRDPRSIRDMAAGSKLLHRAATFILAKAKEAKGQAIQLNAELKGVDPATFDEFEGWLNEPNKPKQAALLPSEAARLRAAGLEDACWEGYEAVGMKEQGGKQVPNCVPTKTAAHRLDGVRGHQLLPATVARKLPAIYSQENVDDPVAQVKLFSPYSGAVWYLTEYDPSSKQAFGWADLGMGGGELGYIDITDLEGLNRRGLPLVERDLYWKPMPLSRAKHSRTASQHFAKFPRGEKMTVDEVAEVVGPEFKNMNENPPEAVLAIRRQMEKQATVATAPEVQRLMQELARVNGVQSVDLADIWHDGYHLLQVKVEPKESRNAVGGWSGKTVEFAISSSRYGKFFNLPDYPKVITAVRTLANRSGLTVESIEGPKKVYEYQNPRYTMGKEPRLSGYDGNSIMIAVYP